MTQRAGPLQMLPVLLVLTAGIARAQDAEDTPAARAAGMLQDRLDALLAEGTDIALHPRYEDLLADANQAAEQYAADPAVADIYRIIARCCEALGKHPEKDAAFARYIDALAARDRDQAVAELRREAQALIARRELFVAIKILELALERFPDGPQAAEALYRLGTCHLWMDQFDAAQEALRDVIERWPDSPQAAQAHLRLARTLLAQGNATQAATLLADFLEEAPDAPQRPAALFTLGVARHLAGDSYRALLVYQQVVREAPDSPYAPLARAALVALRGSVVEQAAK